MSRSLSILNGVKGPSLGVVLLGTKDSGLRLSWIPEELEHPLWASGALPHASLPLWEDSLPGPWGVRSCAVSPGQKHRMPAGRSTQLRGSPHLNEPLKDSLGPHGHLCTKDSPGASRGQFSGHPPALPHTKPVCPATCLHALLTPIFQATGRPGQVFRKGTRWCFCPCPSA